jgi:protein TonB
MNTTASHTVSPVSVWPASLGRRTFRMSVDAARELGMNVLEGVKAIPRRGLEISGLLLGTVSASELCVERLQPISCCYPAGPVFRVPEADLALELSRIPPEITVVGMYRSRTNGGIPDIDFQDELLLRKLDTDHCPAVLLIAQTKDAVQTARLGVWTDTGMEWAGEPVRFAEWVDRKSVSPPPQPSEPIVRHVAPPAPARLAVPALSTRKLPYGRVAWAAALILILSAAAFLWTGRLVSPARRAHVSQSQPQQKLVTAAAAPIEIQPQPVATLVRIPAPDPPHVHEVAPPGSLVPATEPEPQPVKEFRPPPGLRAASRPAVQLLTEAPSVAPLPLTTSPAALLPSLDAVRPQPGSVRPDPPVTFVPPSVADAGSQIVVPPDLRRMLQTEVAFGLRVAVDMKGRVQSVTAVNSPGRREQAFIRVYSSAIRDWTFMPAQRNGEPVPGEAILNFRISPDHR